MGHLHEGFICGWRMVPGCHCKWCISTKALAWALFGWMY
jgi:hypothetical protein